MERYHLWKECIYHFEKGNEKEMLECINMYKEKYGIHPFKDEF